MDATHTPRMAIPIDVAGRRINLNPPTSEQIMGLSFADSAAVSEGTQLKVLSELLMNLMPEEADRQHVIMQLVTNQYSADEFVKTMQAIVTTAPVDLNAPEADGPVVPPRARKAAAKKAAARKRT